MLWTECLCPLNLYIEALILSIVEHESEPVGSATIYQNNRVLYVSCGAKQMTGKFEIKMFFFHRSWEKYPESLKGSDVKVRAEYRQREIDLGHAP